MSAAAPMLQVVAGGCQPRHTVPTSCRRRGWVPGMAAKLLRRHSSRWTGVWGPAGGAGGWGEGWDGFSGAFLFFYKHHKKNSGQQSSPLFPATLFKHSLLPFMWCLLYMHFLVSCVLPIICQVLCGQVQLASTLVLSPS
jgi:hypothetical protein